VLLFALCAAMPPPIASAQGGPPLITDDPDTPGPGYWEINLSSFLERSHQSRAFESPRLDLNYGVGRRIQLKFEVPWLRVAEDGQAERTGAGNAVAGVKWRFIGEEGRHVAWSVYPQLEFNTTHASVTKGLVEDGRQLLLPTELTLEAFHVEINGEAGRTFVQLGAPRWVYGLSTEGHVMPRLELLAELHGERQRDEPAEVIANAGAREKLTRQIVLMIAVGRAVGGVASERPHLLLFTGLQFNVPGLYDFRQADGRARHAR
jgi:hypothetical protein